MATRRDRFQRDVAVGLARTATCVGMEKTLVRRMSATGKGSNARPGVHVGAKTGLNRALLRAAPGALRQRIIRACRKAGVPVFTVPAAHISTTCAACGHRAKENRESQAKFRCRACHTEANADVNAARNIEQAALAACLTHARGTAS